MRYLSRALCIAVLVVTLALGPVAPALAAAPSLTPVTVRSLDFESPLPAWVTTAPYYLSGEPTPTAYWGRRSGAGRSGSWGLWCAGSVVGTPTSYWPKYPRNTRGDTFLSLPELADYYSSAFSFYYTLPSRGAADDRSFVVTWGNPTQPGGGGLNEFPLVSSWVPRTFEFTPEGVLPNLSRKAVTVDYFFIDFVEGGLQSPSTGMGPVVDDVTVCGWKYGPPRSLTATAGPAQIALAWQRPLRSVSGTQTEERSVAYRVWRSVAGEPVPQWVELTGARIADGGSGASYDDTSAVAGTTYRYLVQSWDSGTGTGYGMWAEATARIPNPAGIDLQNVSVPDVVSGSSVTSTYTVTNTGDTTLTTVSVTDHWGTVSGGGVSIEPSATHVFTRTRVLTETVANVATANATSEGLPVSDVDTYTISVHNPQLSLESSPAVDAVSVGQQVAFSYNVRNDGDVALSDVTVVDGSAHLVGTVQTLGPGEDATLVMIVPVSNDITVTALATGEYGTPGTSFHGTVEDGSSASVRVVPDRIEGADRMATAVQVSKAAFPAPLSGPDKAVVIATAFGWPDALSASALAGSVGGPLLLVRPDSVPADVMAEIARLGAEKAYVIGSESVVRSSVVTQLQGAGLTVDRLSGPDRYATSADVAAEVLALRGGAEGGTVFVATGANFPDALGASSLAAAMKAPIILTTKDALPTASHNALVSLQPDTAVVCGSASAVGSGVESALGSAAYGSPDVVRKGGAGRYDTAKALVDYGAGAAGAAPAGGPTGVYLATGLNYPDALAGGVLAGLGGGQWRPLMLTDPKALSPQAEAVISGYPLIGFVSVLGGSPAVSQDVVDAALEALPGTVQ